MLNVLAEMSETIRSIRTPLGLAALALLVGAPLLRQILLRKGRPNADTQSIVRYAFIVGLVFGVLAIISSIYSDSLNREVRISGTVRDESGVGVPFAAVGVPGKDGGVTNDTGTFAFTIAGARAASEYQLEAFKEGYEIGHATAAGTHPDPVSITLKRIDYPPEAVVRLPATLALRHNLGVPQVEIALVYTNPYPRKVVIEDLSLALNAPAGTPIPMLLEGISVAPNVWGPPLPLWELEKSQNAVITYSFFNTDADFLQLQQRVMNEVLPQQANIKGPDPTARILSDPLVKDLRAHLASRFIYAAGTWQFTLRYRLEGRSIERKATFALTNDNIAKMRAIGKYYQAGLGVLPIWRFWQSEDANPAVFVHLKENR